MRVNDSTPREDGEPTSFAKAKNWCKKHEPKLRAAGAVGLAVGLAVVRHLAERQDTERYDAETYEVENIADSEPDSTAETMGEPRQPPALTFGSSVRVGTPAMKRGRSTRRRRGTT